MMVDGMQEERKQKKIGGAEGSRTPDLLIANETLYQLSYDPNLDVRFAISLSTSKNFNTPLVTPKF
jgi:hypothetical protein